MTRIRHYLYQTMNNSVDLLQAQGKLLVLKFSVPRPAIQIYIYLLRGGLGLGMNDIHLARFQLHVINKMR